MDNYRIRTAQLSHMDFLIRQAHNEGWNPGLSDGEAFYRADPGGFFIGELSGKAIACISAVRYGDFGFIGLYIVKEEYRGKGYGILLWRHAMEYLKGCKIGLDGVVDRQDDYKKWGFVLAHRNMRFAAPATVFPVPKENPGVISINDVEFSSLVAYDRLHFPEDRTDFLYAWLNMPSARSLAYVDNGQIQGLATIRECYEGYKVGPLFASEPEIAHILLSKLACFADGKILYLDIPADNVKAQELTASYDMKFVFETARMYRGNSAPINQDSIYGITTFELG
ncbi:GNAT family N-acetyltransferase [Candidatus Contubernalis alkaliaceticus]|uniref:GNAT family N-acetyltransferase n=1 Tax=Candidatus Contubernalis alkaliaceticus TaxID=338645 RepID=UPI001F4BE73D|nr:GNAT family N-acetyltransferase [Candidatus Contubernalis alkalaceticus]UNC93517.1 GNAT family N-acetyltransferase [Candidatus Contubernalis alkalaceticus]